MPDYPRIGQTVPEHPNKRKVCKKCHERATVLVHIQYDYMRGNDEVEPRCDLHKKEV